MTTVRGDDESLATYSSNLTKDVLLNATDDELRQMGVPERPSKADALSQWLRDYTGINSTSDAAQEVFDQGSISSSAKIFGPPVKSANWAGYAAGTPNVINQAYVAVKGNFVVPSVSPSCTLHPLYGVGAWVGLGGQYNVNRQIGDDLLQQGIGWCAPGTTNNFYAWTEFAGSSDPTYFCEQSPWKLNAGDVIYNNMSFQASSNSAYFYMEDQTTGIKHGCMLKPSKSTWAYNGNTAECIIEPPLGSYLSDFGTMNFSNCQVELGSNSTWYPIGQRSTVTRWDNYDISLSYLLDTTSPLGADGMTFSVSFLQHS